MFVEASVLKDKSVVTSSRPVKDSNLKTGTETRLKEIDSTEVRNSILRLVVGCAAVLVFCGFSSGQTCAPPVPSKIVSFPAGTVIEGVGTSDLPVTTKSEKCRTLTKQGFALIHCFWFNEAVRSFRDATKEDPECAIAWCGLAVSETLPWNRDSDFGVESRFAMKRSIALYDTASDIEKAVIAAFRTKDLASDDLKGPFADAMNRIAKEYPDVFEPRLLMAAIRTQVCMFDRTLPNGEVQNELVEVAKLIAPVLLKDPKNPAANHYQIHAYEGSTPEKALPSARILGQVAPASAHMVHMPGHLYNVLGMWDDADKSFGDANRIGEDYAKQIGASPAEADWNYSHNRDYWGVSLGEEGRIREAFELVNFSGRRNQILWRVSDWPALLKAVEKAGNSSDSAFYRGIASAHLGDLKAAKAELKRLREAQGKSVGNPYALIGKTRRLELDGVIKCLSNDFETGLPLLRQAVQTFSKIEYEEPPYYMRPPHETLADMLRRNKKFAEALQVLESGLKVKRNAGTIFYLVARVHEDAGAKEKAKLAFERFLLVWSKADSDRPQVRYAKGALAKGD